jgi:hypothetical protein
VAWLLEWANASVLAENIHKIADKVKSVFFIASSPRCVIGFPVAQWAFTFCRPGFIIIYAYIFDVNNIIKFFYKFLLSPEIRPEMFTSRAKSLIMNKNAPKIGFNNKSNIYCKYVLDLLNSAEF